MRPTAKSLSACWASGLGGPPVWSSMIHRMLNAELVGDAQIELREVLDEVVGHCRDRRLCLDGVLMVQRRLEASLELLRVRVKFAPARLAGRAVRLQERIVLDVFAVDLHRQTGGRRFRE